MSPRELHDEVDSAKDALARLEAGSEFPQVDADEVRRCFAMLVAEVRTRAIDAGDMNWGRRK